MRYVQEVILRNQNTTERMKEVCGLTRFPVVSIYPESTPVGDVYRVDCQRMSPRAVSKLADYFMPLMGVKSPVKMQKILYERGFTIAAEDCDLAPWPPEYMLDWRENPYESEDDADQTN